MNVHRVAGAGANGRTWNPSVVAARTERVVWTRVTNSIEDEETFVGRARLHVCKWGSRSVLKCDAPRNKIKAQRRRQREEEERG